MMNRFAFVRRNKSLHICSAPSYIGCIDNYLIDPPIPYIGEKTEPFLKYDENDGVWNVVAWIDEKEYINVWDFIEEARIYGISIEVPYNFEFDKLSPFRSKLILIHPKVIFGFEYDTGICPKFNEHKPTNVDKYATCLYALKHMGIFEEGENHKVEFYKDYAIVNTRLVSYKISYPVKPEGRFKMKLGKKLFVCDKKLEYAPGIFASINITHMEWISNDLKMPLDLWEKARKSKIKIRVKER